MEPNGVRCSSWFLDQAPDPIGSAGTYGGYMLVEWPLPWPAEVGEIPELAPVNAACALAGLRMQLVVPDRTRGPQRVSRFTSSSTGAGYDVASRATPTGGDIVATAVSLAGGGRGDLEASSEVDVLICSHGRRDVCCGSLGTSFAVTLEADVQVPARVWRTSHTGGHRFAPTAVVLPQGTAWAYVDIDLIRRVVGRVGHPADLLDRYRGSMLMPGSVQVLEREVLREVGWSWLDWRRAGIDLGEGRVRIEAEAPSGDVCRWEASVAVRRRLPVPECGQPIEASTKTVAEYALVGEVDRRT